MAPIPDLRRERRGVVAEGPVGTKWAGRFRLFRYEIRRWREGVIPDAREAISTVSVGIDLAGRLAPVRTQGPPPLPRPAAVLRTMGWRAWAYTGSDGTANSMTTSARMHPSSRMSPAQSNGISRDFGATSDDRSPSRCPRTRRDASSYSWAFDHECAITRSCASHVAHDVQIYFFAVLDGL
jgi:hypothetical protein